MSVSGQADYSVLTELLFIKPNRNNLEIKYHIGKFMQQIQDLVQNVSVYS